MEAMTMNSQHWNPDDLNREFQARAETADRYLLELPAKISKNRSYEHLFDQTMAEFWVFNHLRDRPYLDARDNFLSALGEFRDREIKPGKVYDLIRFEQYRQNLIQSLFDRFGQASSN